MDGRKPERSDVVEHLAHYLEDVPEQRIKARVAGIVKDAKKIIADEAAKKAKYATKEYLVEAYRFFAYVEDLEKAPWFIRWLEKLDGKGHQMFLAKCARCDGTGKREAMFGGRLLCNHCAGSGEITGPDYCHRCSLLAICCRSSCGGR